MVQILDIPENETELALWLESLLVSRDFGDAVSQLAFLGSVVCQLPTQRRCPKKPRLPSLSAVFQ